MRIYLLVQINKGRAPPIRAERGPFYNTIYDVNHMKMDLARPLWEAPPSSQTPLG